MGRPVHMSDIVEDGSEQVIISHSVVEHVHETRYITTISDIEPLLLHIRILSKRAFDLLPGSLLALDHRGPHDLEALDDSAILLTIARPGGRHESIDDNDGPSQT
jgi:hypothetical protein